MSQSGILNVKENNPDIPTQFDGNTGVATPLGNTLNIYGAATAAGSTPVATVASGNTVTTNVQTSQAIVSSDATKIVLAAFKSTDFSVDANGFVSFIGGSSFVESVSGTAHRITSTGGQNPVIDIAADYVGQTSITTLGTITTGTWNGTAINETHGGTNQTTYAQGDMLYASAANTLSKLSKNTSSTRYLSNTGTNNNPAWSQVNITNGITGTLPIANGGTNATSYTASNGILKYNGTSFVNSNNAILDANSIYTNFAQNFVYAKVGTSLTNVTGDGTTVTVIFDTVITQQGTAYNSSTGIFTVATSGVYLCTAFIGWSNLSTAFTRSQINILMGGQITTQIEASPGACQSSSGVYTQQGSVMNFLNNGDTIKVNGFVSGSTKTVGILGENFGQYSCIFIAKIF